MLAYSMIKLPAKLLLTDDIVDLVVSSSNRWIRLGRREGILIRRSTQLEKVLVLMNGIVSERHILDRTSHNKPWRVS